MRHAAYKGTHSKRIQYQTYLEEEQKLNQSLQV